ncbi:MAG: hypothetical protein C5B55_11830 [Blastocatellia bacterium]|nr:MAG: hypothetical protein C5B55_11830 [Blastocatellia bacterium]
MSPHSHMKKTIILVVISLVFVSSVVAVWTAGTVLSAPARASIGSAPTDLVIRNVQFPSESGSMIHGWFIEGMRGAGAIALMHGVRANRTSMLDRARFLAHAGFSVLLFDFQAHGESAGDHITFGYLESRDARAAIDFLRRTVPDEKIGVIGVSMGGAASLLAEPPLAINAIVLEMVYPTINQAVTNRLTMRFGRLGLALAPLLVWQLKPRLGVDPGTMRPIDHVGSMTVAKLFIVGAKDQHTTIEESKKFFAAAHEPKELWIIDAASHVDVYPLAKTEYEQRVLKFFTTNLRQ